MTLRSLLPRSLRWYPAPRGCGPHCHLARGIWTHCGCDEDHGRDWRRHA